MEQEFTHQEQQLMRDILSRHEEELIRRVVDVISEAESAANAEFTANDITFSQHSPANADYLAVFLFGKLLDRLHHGDLILGKRILTMEAKRLGINLHVD
jgi:hypothetical protein